MDKNEILELTQVKHSPFQVAKLDDEKIILICGNYRMDLEDTDVEKLVEELETTRWDAIGLLLEVYISNLMKETENENGRNEENH